MNVDEFLQVLAVLGLAVFATVPLLLHFKRQPLARSEARVLLQRGRQLRREMNALLVGREPWQEVAADADQIMAELKLTAGRAAELDRALSVINSSDPGTAGQVLEIRGIRDALMARMRAAVAGLEWAHAELAALVATAAIRTDADPDPAAALISRLEGLRQGLAEVARLANPEGTSGSGWSSQGHP